MSASVPPARRSPAFLAISDIRSCWIAWIDADHFQLRRALEIYAGVGSSFSGSGVKRTVIASPVGRVRSEVSLARDLRASFSVLTKDLSTSGSSTIR